MSHPDFRTKGRIFATLGYPDDQHGTLILPPDTQAELVKKNPEIFAPAAGAWGRRGSTIVSLTQARAAIVRTAMKIAWEKVAPKNLLGR